MHSQLPPADAHHVAVLQAPERARHAPAPCPGSSWNGRGSCPATLRVGQAVRAEELRRRLAAEAGGALRRQARRVVVGRTDPQPARMLGRAPALAQPVRQADVVRVHVRDQHAQDGQAFQRGGEHLLPLRLGFVPRDAAVDDGPALAAVELVAQQPEVDVVQREGERHPDPAHAGRDLERGAGFGEGVVQRVLQLGFEGIHAMWRTGLVPTPIGRTQGWGLDVDVNVNCNRAF